MAGYERLFIERVGTGWNYWNSYFPTIRGSGWNRFPQQSVPLGQAIDRLLNEFNYAWQRTDTLDEVTIRLLTGADAFLYLKVPVDPPYYYVAGL